MGSALVRLHNPLKVSEIKVALIQSLVRCYNSVMSVSLVLINFSHSQQLWPEIQKRARSDFEKQRYLILDGQNMLLWD